MYHIQREKQGPTGGASRNRKHCKLKGKGPVRGFSVNTSIQFDFTTNTFRQVDAWQTNVPVHRLPSSSLRSHAVRFKLLCRHRVHAVCDDARRHVVAIFETINLLINMSTPQ